MRKLAVYVHGKGGNATESEHYKPLLPEYDVIGFDYKSETPWDAKQEFTNLFDNYCKNYDYIVLIANSIGAFYSMNAFSDKQIDKAMFIQFLTLRLFGQQEPRMVWHRRRRNLI